MKTDKLSSSIIQIDLATKKSKSIKNFNNIIAIQAIKGNDLYYNPDFITLKSAQSPCKAAILYLYR